MLDDQEILDRLDAERRTLARDGEIIDILPDVTRRRAADGSHHEIAFSSLTGAKADAAIEREIAHHQALGVGFEWKAHAHDAPADLLARLGRHGFDIGPREAVLIRDLTDAPPWLADPAEADGVRVRRIDDAARIADYRAVAEAALGKEYSFTAGELAAALRAGSRQHLGYVAYLNDRPVSIGRLYTHPESWFGGLYGGTTLADHRGRGLYRAVVAARARDAAAMGVRYLQVDALPTSQPILERLGFRLLTYTWPCAWEP